jgi:uncharacterized lipoprotein YddW (UPF0748 family)
VDITKQLAGLLFGFLFASSLIGADYAPSSQRPPAPMREFRGVWVASVANIDWPSTNTLSTAQQKAELLAIFDKAVELKLNVIILQVRPACDALYASALEPWSEYLTGTMGQAPKPFYDPLAFAVAEAHQRGLELHAWFNPYRARHPAAKSPAASTHISRTRPNLVKQYGRQAWLDPGEKDVQNHSFAVVMDVVKRYDVDGIHFDDYFYPYKEKSRSGNELDFPDDNSWARFGTGRGLSREDWRRKNINDFIERVYRSIKSQKPWVKFGLSPFGIWRPANPAQIKGYDAFDKLYADSRKWIASGWCDYFVPQLYWPIEPPDHSFPVLLKWWTQQNTSRRQLLAGMDSTRLGAEEIVNQIRAARKESGASGHVHWSMKSLLRNPSLDGALRSTVYREPALVPVAAWLDRSVPSKPRVTMNAGNSSAKANWTCLGTEKTACWVLQMRRGNTWSTRILPGSKTSAELTGPLPSAIALSAVDRCGNSSLPTVLSRKDR